MELRRHDFILSYNFYFLYLYLLFPNIVEGIIYTDVIKLVNYQLIYKLEYLKDYFDYISIRNEIQH